MIIMIMTTSIYVVPFQIPEDTLQETKKTHKGQQIGCQKPVRTSDTRQ